MAVLHFFLVNSSLYILFSMEGRDGMGREGWEGKEEMGREVRGGKET